MTLLSAHFSLEELTASQIAARSGFDNTPNAAVLNNLTKTAELLEEVRTLLGGKPVFISSGYRSPAVNEAAGGAANSAHMYGQAADFTCPSYGSVADICRAIEASSIIYDQVIREFDAQGHGWVHIAWATPNRRQALTIDGSGTRLGIT